MIVVTNSYPLYKLYVVLHIFDSSGPQKKLKFFSLLYYKKIGYNKTNKKGAKLLVVEAIT